MFFRVIDKSEIPALVSGFASEFEVIGPVERKGAFVFDEVGSDPSRLRLDYDMTQLPPKKFLMPPKTTLFEFNTASNDVIDTPIKQTPRVLFGLHSCDINAINNLDAVFMDDSYPDPYYRAQRENTMIVGVDCKPGEHCFCNMLGTDEVTLGYDLYLHDLGDRYLVSILSVKASEILAVSTSARQATLQDSKDFQRRALEFKRSFASGPEVYELPILMDAFYEDTLWEEMGQRCLSCTACSMVCPTCFCFNIADKLYPGGEKGTRDRLWDSCCSPQFALVAGGHNFRPTAASRVRNRFYHKFLGFQNKYGRPLCTGCGRCEKACKAKINPRAVFAGLQQDAIEGRMHAQEGGE